MTDPDARKFETLSDREREALLLLAQGHTVKSIAERTGLNRPGFVGGSGG
jgi:DNA-binding NarL/FixJ family response regulator